MGGGSGAEDVEDILEGAFWKGHLGRGIWEGALDVADCTSEAQDWKARSSSQHLVSMNGVCAASFHTHVPHFREFCRVDRWCLTRDESKV